MLQLGRSEGDGVISEGTDEDEGPRRDDGSENVKLCRRIARTGDT